MQEIRGLTREGLLVIFVATDVEFGVVEIQLALSGVFRCLALSFEDGPGNEANGMLPGTVWAAVHIICIAPSRTLGRILDLMNVSSRSAVMSALEVRRRIVAVCLWRLCLGGSGDPCHRHVF